MPGWLSDTGFDTQVVAALWSTLTAVFATIVLFTYTLGLRVSNVIGDHQRARLIARWRGIFATAMLSRDDADRVLLPRLRRYQRTTLLEEWNLARDAVEGGAAENLIVVADRLGLRSIARRRLRRRRLSTRLLAVQTLGHLRDTESWDGVAACLASPNTALSITAAVALMDMDAARGLAVLIPMITERRDWPRTRVSRLLRMAGSELVSEPLYRAIRSGDDDDKIYLLQFAPLAEAEVIDALCEEILRGSNDPGVLNAALKHVSGYGGVPRIAALAHHKTWYVRMQAAKVLGRIGRTEHLSLLEAMLDDREWWVRYRAAQSIASLPFLGPNAVRGIRDRQRDAYAKDILDQAMAEVGLA